MGHEQYEDKQVDKELGNGPVENRSCTDILCCLFFVAAVYAMIGVFGYGVNNGQPKYLKAIYDYDQRACGIHPAAVNYPYAYLTNPYPGLLQKVMCVKSCPTNMSATLDCLPTSISPTCTGFNYNLIGSMSSSEVISSIQAFKSGTLTYIYGSTVYFGAICIPEPSILAQTSLGDMINNGIGTLQKYFADLLTAWWVVLSCVAAALFAGLIYMLLIRLAAGCIVFVTIMAFLGALGALGYLFYNKGQNPTSGQDNKNLVYIGYAFWALDVIFVIIFCCQRQALRLAVAVVKSAGLFIMECKTVLFVPILGQILLLAIFAYWFTGFVYIYTMGTPQRTPQFPFNQFIVSDSLRNFLYYWIFMGLWMQAYISAFVQYCIASACAIWYFSQGTGQLMVMPVGKSIYRAFRYHIGSLAFGSFLLAVVRMIRFILWQLQQQANKGGDNAVLKFILGCLQCYMACFERFIEFLNKNAYIQIAISGKSFCPAAKDAFLLILRNPGRFAMLGAVGDIFSFLGVLIITVLGTLYGYIICTRYNNLAVALYSPLLPTIACFILSAFIAVIFMSVYDMSIDTILQAFFMDEELAKNDPNYVGHQPSYIKEIIDEIDKKVDAKKSDKNDDNISHNVKD